MKINKEEWRSFGKYILNKKLKEENIIFNRYDIIKILDIRKIYFICKML